MPGSHPAGRKIGQLPILGVIEYPPLTPAPTAIDKLEFSSLPWVKRVGHTENTVLNPLHRVQFETHANVQAEAFFSTLKTECFPDNQVFASRARARRETFEYIEVYYNNQRLHSALGYKA